MPNLRALAIALLAFAVAGCAPVTRVFIEFEAPSAPPATEAPVVSPAPTVAPTPEPTAAPAPEPTYEPITFSNITVEEVGPDYAVISWNVAPPAQGQVVYGLTTEYELGATTMETSLLGFHRQRVSGLQPETTYHFAVVAFIPDPDGGEPMMALVPVQ